MRYYYLLAMILLLGCKEGKKYHDEVEKTAAVSENSRTADVLEFQKKLNAEFKDPETSPLPDRYRKDFESLDFFEIDTTYRVLAKLVLTPEALPFLMPTTTERKSKERVYGIAQFELKGNRFELEIYQNEELMQQEGYADYLFLPFTDRTNGEQTYGGGRYIDLRIPQGDSIVIDFNRAYNPYCTYNKKYSCPIVPAVNALDIAILAGVKAFKKE